MALFQIVRLAIVVLAVALVAGCGNATPIPTPTDVSRVDAPSAGPTPTPASAASSPATSSSPIPKPQATPLVPPLSPTHVTFTVKPIGQKDSTGYYPNSRRTVTWTEATGMGIEMRVYGVTKCLIPAKPSGPNPCLVPHTSLPSADLKLIAKAPAEQGSVSWVWPSTELLGEAFDADGHQAYYAIVIAAYNAAGPSRFVIVGTGSSCKDCVY